MSRRIVAVVCAASGRCGRARADADRTLSHHLGMARIVFTPQLRRFTSTPEVDSPATTLRAALDDAFAVNPPLRAYVLDDQGHLRPNVAVFIDGRRNRDFIALSDELGPDSTVHVLQALSGG
jgi:hypothetical protein